MSTAGTRMRTTLTGSMSRSTPGWVRSVEWKGIELPWSLGRMFNMYVEGNPPGNIEDITYNARPYISVTPINNLNLRLYVDNVFVKSPIVSNG